MGAMTLSIALCHLALHGAFTWARFVVFRIDGATPTGVRIIEVSATVSSVAGLALIAFRLPGPVILDPLALLIAATSAGLFTWGLRTVRPGQLTAAFSPDPPTQLLTSGPYRHLRHPFYLAYMLAHAVPCIATRSPWAWLCLGWMTAIYVRASVLEERKFLASPLASAYRCYRRRTGRFVPRLVRL